MWLCKCCPRWTLYVLVLQSYVLPLPLLWSDFGIWLTVHVLKGGATGYCRVKIFIINFCHLTCVTYPVLCRYPRPTLEPVDGCAIVDAKVFCEIGTTKPPYAPHFHFNITIISPYYLMDCHPLWCVKLLLLCEVFIAYYWHTSYSSWHDTPICRIYPNIILEVSLTLFCAT